MIPDNVLGWLHDEGIDDKTINNNSLSWNGSKIVIPIFDRYGNFLFNKYRRDPFSTVGPKYIYDAGTSAQLFHSNHLIDSDTVIIVEGEKDAMRLEAEGWLAVSTTGGAGTWNDEWTTLLRDKDVFICYDNDDAGLKGAVKLLTKIPGHLVVLPRMKGVKDVCDFFKQNSWKEFYILLRKSKKYQELSELPIEATTIKKAKENIKMYKLFLKDIDQERIDIRNQQKGETFYYDYLRQPLEDIIAEQERIIHKIQMDRAPVTEAVNVISAEDINRAKSVKIDALFTGKTFRSGGRKTGRCPFHESDDTPSFTIYANQNRFFCFACQAQGDAIEYVMRTDGCDFKTAVNKLLKWT